jgi:hypothetical protein
VERFGDTILAFMDEKLEQEDLLVEIAVSSAK